ncbi:hypothetical protein [Streptomyces sp. NBC_00467]|uniref:hypothetical protein n=1 Tax=Streptomyces sp. NBC_00467 TaxID=2975752 RepID=UPI002E17718E
MDGGTVTVAYPICPDEAVAGALVSVRVDGDGRGDGFETLWSADGPVSAEAREGVFRVGSPQSFRDEGAKLVGRLPVHFSVETRTVVDGQAQDGYAGVVDLAKARGKRLAEGEYVTWEGKVLTRDQINDQRRCDGDSRT